MYVVKHNWHTLEMYDSIEELNIVRYQDFSRYAAIDLGIGSGVESINDHLSLISKKFENNQVGEGLQAIANLQTCVHLIMSGANPELMSFCCLIKSINGKEVTDFSESGINSLKEELADKKVTIRVIRTFLDYVKKKLRMS